MFTDALLRALTTRDKGIFEKGKSQLSLRELTTLTADLLADSPERNAPRPYLLSPDQSEGDVADVPFFPNLAAKETQARQVAESQKTGLSLWDDPSPPTLEQTQDPEYIRLSRLMNSIHESNMDMYKQGERI